jgi:hypothetical protein
VFGPVVESSDDRKLEFLSRRRWPVAHWSQIEKHLKLLCSPNRDDERLGRKRTDTARHRAEVRDYDILRGDILDWEFQTKVLLSPYLSALQTAWMYMEQSGARGLRGAGERGIVTHPYRAEDHGQTEYQEQYR